MQSKFYIKTIVLLLKISYNYINVIERKFYPLK